MPIPLEYRRKINSAHRDARMTDIVVDLDLVKNEAEAVLVAAIIKAYGNSPSGFIYHSPGRARSALRPPDIVLCHPEVDLLVIDAKKHMISGVEDVQAGHVLLRYQGRIRPKNVVQQVEEQMYEIKSDARKLLRYEKDLPLFSSMLAFPNIFESEWAAEGFDSQFPLVYLLFREHFEKRDRLRKRIGQLVSEGLKRAHMKKPLIDEHVGTLYRVFGKASVVNESRPPRAWVEEETLGDYVDEMAALDKYLSKEQQTLSRMQFEGSPRLVRGVAGSGKSVVLANIVARYIHRRLDSLENPNLPELDISIAVTCFNRALVDFLKRRIRDAYREQTITGDIPSRVMVATHLYDLMKTLKSRGWMIDGVPFHILQNQGPSVWASMYREQIHRFRAQNPDLYHSLCFDALFVDEGQDFEPEEYRLMQDLVRSHEVTDEKPIVIFYDDAQNVYGRTRPVWRDIGFNFVGGERSRVMRECFRNTRQIVELAFNVLLGSQAPDDMRVQMRTYADINYLKEIGIVEETGDHIRVGFAEREYRRPDVRGFPDVYSEHEWIASEIVRLIQQESVRPEDILLVFFRPSVFDYASVESKIADHIHDMQFVRPFGDSTDKDRYIFQPGRITVSTVYGAKGYDAPITFLAGADRFGSDKEGRAAFYVAATRAKLLLYVSGVNSAHSLLSEATSISQVL